MEATEKIELAESNIWQALRDYFRHTRRTEVLDDVSDTFIRRLAKDNYYAKQELCELFRKSPVWNEELDALVINGTRTHNLDYERIRSMANDILAPAFAGCDEERQLGIKCRKNHLSNNSLFANCFF